MTISLRLSDEDTMLIKKYAEMNNISVSDLFRQSVLERIEDEYEADPVTYSHDEVGKMLGLI